MKMSILVCRSANFLVSFVRLCPRRTRKMEAVIWKVLCLVKYGRIRQPPRMKNMINGQRNQSWKWLRTLPGEWKTVRETNFLRRWCVFIFTECLGYTFGKFPDCVCRNDDCSTAEYSEGIPIQSERINPSTRSRCKSSNGDSSSRKFRKLFRKNFRSALATSPARALHRCLKFVSEDSSRLRTRALRHSTKLNVPTVNSPFEIYFPSFLFADVNSDSESDALSLGFCVSLTGDMVLRRKKEKSFN